MVDDIFRTTPADMPPEVAAVLDALSAPIRAALLDLRDLIRQVAAFSAPQSRLVETLRWGEPAYMTEHPRSGTTIRINQDRKGPGDYALYVPCSTPLVADWRIHFPNLTYGGNRSVHFRLHDPFPRDTLAQMIAAAMTCHKA